MSEVRNVTIFSTATSGMKWWISIFLGILFFIFSLPATYRFTSQVYSIIEGASYDAPNDCSRRVIIYSPSISSIFTHALLFTLVVRLIFW